MLKEKIVCLTPLEGGFFKSLLENWIDFSNIDLEMLPGDVAEDEICKAVADATVIFSDGRHITHITRKVIESAPNLKLIQTPTVGYDEIDLDAANEYGIPVANTAGSNAISVAEHAIMFMLVLLKKAIYAHESTLRGDWPQMDLVVGGKVMELGGKTLGILGLGDIGLEVVRLASAFGPRVLYNKRSRLSVDKERQLGIEFVELDELLRQSDILSIHVSLNSDSRGMISRDEISMMKDGAILLNLARGPVVDETALVEALKNGKLSGAGLDVFYEEPLGQNNAFEGLDNIILSPHVSGGTKEMMGRAFKMCGENLSRVFSGKRPENVVNLK
jgi:glyoxylate reductase